MLYLRILSIPLVILLCGPAYAGHKYWVARDDGTPKYWNDNANWSNSRRGSAGGAAYPRIGDKVIFNGRSTVDCTLRANAKTRRLQVWSGYTGTINLAGYDLHSKQGAKIHGGTFNVSSGKLSTEKWNSVIGSAATVNARDSTLFFGKGLNIQGTLNAPTGNLTVRGNWANSGTFNHNSGTVIFNPRRHNHTINPGGTGSGKAFYNIKKVGRYRNKLIGNISLNNFEIAYKGGTWQAQGYDMSVSGNWKVNNLSGFTHGNNTVTLNGSTTQTINIYPNKGDFYNLTVSNTASLETNGLKADNTLTIGAGSTFDINGQNLTAVELSNAGTLQLQGGETVSITTMDTDSGTVTYDGTGTYTQLAAGDEYYNLTLNTAGTITLDANLDVNGTLSITDGTLDVSSSNYNINVSGNWINNDSFISRSGTVTFDGSSTVTTGGISNTKDFHHVTLNGSQVSQSTNAIDIGGNFTLSGGTWYTNGLCTYVTGSTTISGSGALNRPSSLTTTFEPGDTDTDVPVASNITITFGQAVRKTDDTELTNTNVKSLITLKDTNASGSNINFDATINDEKKVITITPKSNLSSLQTVYIGIGASVENSCDEAISATNITFTVVDSSLPTLISSTPSDGQTDFGVSSNIVLNFSESVDAESGNITVKKASDGSTVETIDVTGSKVSGSGTAQITIDPSTTLDGSTSYYLNIDASAFDDGSSNSYAGISDTTTLNFTTADIASPTVTFSPTDGNTGIAPNTTITITFNEAVRNTDDTDLTDTNVDSLITLKDTNANGSDIDFDATIDTDKKVITINPISDLSSEQIVYVAIGATVEDSSGNAITASSINFTAAKEDDPPTITFSPTDGTAGIAADVAITITFDKAVRNTDDTELTITNVDSLITLKDTNASGSDISFDATIDTAKKVITINPSSDLTSEQTVYVAIGATVEDASGNAITETSATFDVADATPPVVTFTPQNSATGVAVNSDVTIAFDELVRNVDDTALTDANVDSLITLRDTNASGSNIAFDAVVDNDKKLITITPTNTFSSEQTVYVTIGATVEDASGNAITATSTTFTTADSTAPSVSFIPPDSSTGIPITSNVVLTFSEAVRRTDDVSLTNTNVANLLTLEYISDQSPISFTASIDSEKKVITITPDSDFTSGRVVYVAIESVEDFSNNAMGATSGTFSVTDSTSPTVEFSPADLSTSVALDTNITITFDEETRLIDNSELTDTNVDSLITLKNTDASGSDIAFDATIDSEKKIITINPVDDFSSDQIIYIAIGATVEDSYNNAISPASATFTSADALPPSVTIEAVITASIATDSNITFTFSEAVRNVDDTALTNTNVGSLITLKDTGPNGFDIPFSASINDAKTIITIDPTSNFKSKQTVYAAIGATVEDFANNVVPASSKTFVAEYLVSSLTNPFDDKDFVGLMESQLETSKLFIRQSTMAVLKRIEWLRRHREDKNLSNQGIRLKFPNSDFRQLANALQLHSRFNKSGVLLRNDWAVWSEGNVTIGEVDDTAISSMKDIRSTGISVGIDKKIDEHLMYGAALRVSNYNVDIGSSGNNLHTNAYSLSLYGTIPFSDEKWIDGTFGIGRLKIDQTRKHDSGTLHGSRRGKQIFGSIVYTGEFSRDELTISPYGRLDAGYTVLANFNDYGTVAALNYKKQKIRQGEASLGMLVDNTINLKGLSLKPSGRFEYGKKISSSSDAVVSYLSIPDTKYSLNINDDKTDSIRAGMGIDINPIGKWSFTASYERNQEINTSYTDTLSLSASYLLNSNTRHSVSIINGRSRNPQFEWEFDLGSTTDWSVNANSIVSQTGNSTYEVTAQLRINLNF